MDDDKLLAVKRAEFARLSRRMLSDKEADVTLPESDDGRIAQTYEHRMVCGEGGTAEEAINDWFGKLPTNPVETIIWRVYPEISSEVDYDTKKRTYRVFSRFAIVPLNSENKDAA